MFYKTWYKLSLADTFRWDHLCSVLSLKPLVDSGVGGGGLVGWQGLQPLSFQKKSDIKYRKN